MVEPEMMTPAMERLNRRLKIGTWILTIAVLLLVGMMRHVKIPLPESVSFDFLPPMHASFNALTAVVLIYAFLQIRKKNVDAHRKAIYVAFGLSFLFLLSYVAYHFTTPEVLYGDADGDGILSAAEETAVGSRRTIYLTILGTHIVLAGAIFPFILFTFIRAYTGRIEAHRRMARWVFPLWLYVAITGPIVYLMLRPYY